MACTLGDNAATSRGQARDRNRNTNLFPLVTICRVIYSENAYDVRQVEVFLTIAARSVVDFVDFGAGVNDSLLVTSPRAHDSGGFSFFSVASLSHDYVENSSVWREERERSICLATSRGLSARSFRAGQDDARRDRAVNKICGPAIANVRLNRGSLPRLPRSSAGLLGTFQGT